VAVGDIVLLVDDDPEFVELLALQLADEVVVRTALSGDQAWDQLQSELLPDLIVSDLSMPGMGGDELTRRISADPRLRHIPVILLTGRDDGVLRQRLLAMGAADYLVKPFPAAELRIRVRNTLRITNLVRDLATARDEAERAYAAVVEVNTELDRFASSVAHDLQVPLANIASFSRLVREYGIEGERHDKILEAIEYNAEQAREQIDDLLAQARTLGTHGAHDNVDLGEATARVEELLARQVESTGARISNQAGGVRVRASSLAIERILLNLMQNALKFGRPGVDPDIVIRAEPSSGSAAQVEVVVVDNGRGVPDDLRVRVLQDGDRGEGHGEGTGIGLAAVRRVVTWYDGRIWLTGRSEGGPGLEVHLTLPSAAG